MTSLEFTVAGAQQRLQAALETVAGIRVPDVGVSVSPPAAIIGPPRLTWGGYGSVGTGVLTVQWNVYLVMPVNQYAVANLLALVETVTCAIEKYTPGVVLSSGPGSYTSPGGALPAYVITVQMEPGAF